MHIRKLVFATALLLGFILLGCQKEEDCPESIIGEWQWTRSFAGGFTGAETNPESEGESRLLAVDENFIHRFTNFSRTSKEQYEVTFDDNSDQMILELESGGKLSVTFDECSIILRSINSFGGSEVFTRI